MATASTVGAPPRVARRNLMDRFAAHPETLGLRDALDARIVRRAAETTCTRFASNVSLRLTDALR